VQSQLIISGHIEPALATKHALFVIFQIIRAASDYTEDEYSSNLALSELKTEEGSIIGETQLDLPSAALVRYVQARSFARVSVG